MLPLLCKLQKADLLRAKPTGPAAAAVVASKGAGAASGVARFGFPPIKRTFRLLVDEVDEHVSSVAWSVRGHGACVPCSPGGGQEDPARVPTKCAFI